MDGAPQGERETRRTNSQTTRVTRQDVPSSSSCATTLAACSAIHRIILEGLRTACIWIVPLIIFYSLEGTEHGKAKPGTAKASCSSLTSSSSFFDYPDEQLRVVTLNHLLRKTNKFMSLISAEGSIEKSPTIYPILIRLNSIYT